MSNQRHDIGRQKREKGQQGRIPLPNTERLARELVLKGLASPAILGRPYRETNR